MLAVSWSWIRSPICVFCVRRLPESLRQEGISAPRGVRAEFRPCCTSLCLFGPWNPPRRCPLLGNLILHLRRPHWGPTPNHPARFGPRSLVEQCCTAECSGSIRTQTFTDFLYFWVMRSPRLMSLLLLNALGKGITRRASGDLWILPIYLRNYI